ncbi:hypothetical protein [Sandaracinobacteroides saxicola]|uniref:Uncharacterized protein n=1 Tax=Sandaracinobacteroides saxicola TaxID=2759707 RepID=A0A7G5IJV6_9SPHN|nr:hypothetical protein [Sandaracinobacteroides saxicola]QMW23648.1 hypothetical protein H3309_03925 [Sandaracinobacteroides saxicola]
MTDLDQQLRAWATTPAGDQAALARILAGVDAATRPVPAHRWRWAMGSGALAAGIAAAWLLLTPTPAPAPSVSPDADTLLVSVSDPAKLSFATLYTPTPDEEQYL